MATLFSARERSAYLYNHEVPLRLHLRHLYRLKAQELRACTARVRTDVAYCWSHPAMARQRLVQWFRTQLTSTRLILILLWTWLLWHHEVRLFQDSIDRCSWHLWESWPADAQPHHLVFVADPQLVDAHTYPGRPWPLSSLTILEADIYLRRGFSRIQRDLDPDTVLFLGDLFDGGREWATRWSSSPEERFKPYGNDYWMKEYRRFTHLFFKNHGQRPGQRMIASLPGNHDLGFASGVQLPVRDRFQMMFGQSNRVDVIGNHTFVSIDSVSLSARDEEDDSTSVAEIWKPTWDFLEHVETEILMTVDAHLRTLAQQELGVYHQGRHFRQEVDEYAAAIQPLARPLPQTADYPSILLSHVPLYRPAGTPCGPQRERHPPSAPESGQGSLPEFDERNALTIARGYQYQNVISQDLTKHIIDKLGGMVSYAFSGDDHDYCELVHRAYRNPGRGIREITVKSLSFTMGVRKPGFVMVSLWNPIDVNGQRASARGSETLQSHLCLLPDQLGIFLHYAMLLVASLFTLLVRAFLVTYVPSRFGTTSKDVPSLLPMHVPQGNGKQELEDGHSSTNIAQAAVSAHERTEMFARSGTRPRGSSITCNNGYANGKAHAHASHYHESRGHKTKTRAGGSVQTSERRGRITKPVQMLREWAISLWRVAWVVMLWFLWLQRTY